MLLSALHHHLYQVGKDEDVYEEQHRPDGRDAANDFEDLPWQEGRGDHEGHVFSPGFFQVQADSLRRAQSGVGKQSYAEAAQGLVVYQRSLVENEIDEMGLGAEMEMVSEAGYHFRQIVMDEAQRADGHHDKESGLGKLESGNQHQPTVVFWLAHESLEWGVDDFLSDTACEPEKASLDRLNDLGWFTQKGPGYTEACFSRVLACSTVGFGGCGGLRRFRGTHKSDGVC